MIQRLKFRGKALAGINIPNEHHTKIVKEMKVGEFMTTDDLIGAENTVHPSLEGDRLTLFFELVARGGIDPSTVGQWTGLKDSKGVEIWEGDVIESGSDSGFTAVVVFEDGQFTGHIEWLHDLSIARGWSDTVTVIGTIHDKEQA